MFEEYYKFISSKNILPTAIALVLGTIVTDIVRKIKDDIILPISKFDFDTLIKNFDIREYIGLLIHFFMQTYLLFLLSKTINNLDFNIKIDTPLKII